VQAEIIIGAQRTGTRLSPYIAQRNMTDDEIIEVILKAAGRLDRPDLYPPVRGRLG